MSSLNGRAAAPYFDPKIGAQAISVLPGHHAVTDLAETAVTTLLGSCVAACIRDVDKGIGGLNHFLLPGEDRTDGARSSRYGVHAMEVLINDILKRGGRKDRMEAKVFGGANVIDVSSKDTVGARNAQFVKDYLRMEGIRLAASDCGGERARRVYFFPSTGRASVLRLPASETRVMRRSESQLAQQAKKAPAAGGVELF
ncbi:chemotaxis protein CheD [Albimonas sp. CAU 1670]|uniref:chemotaxis protein CheD n=1 Tax=Albimonas sp. CAU 1670 TaxID=3032599 RepID=UPI0023DAA0DD|nr:chemotaxis protein CheD [Albimonas sp. CAU 1670]MDF2231123.1 chemotaxis protein CheD [Albimonas sp. CAU 1670]